MPDGYPKVGGDLALSPHHKLTVSGSYTLPFDESIGKITFGATYYSAGLEPLLIGQPRMYGLRLRQSFGR